MSAFPPKDARTVTDDRIQDETPKPQGTRQQREGSVFHVSTADGDVKTLVVEPSFDGSEREPKQEEKRESWQGVRATEEGKSVTLGRTHPSPEDGKKPASHARNLSAHFFDAATIKEGTSEPATHGVSFDDQSQRSYPIYPTQHSSHAPVEQPTAPATGVPPVSPAVGQKHRRGISEDLSNPAFAHRRINSIGNAAPVERGQGQNYYAGGNYPPPAYDHQSYVPPQQQPASHHHREDSAGLDILSAAIHASDAVSKEELADAAGASKSADQPTAPSPIDASLGRGIQRSPSHDPPGKRRMSPSTMDNVPYDYAQTGGAMNAPPFRPQPHPSSSPQSAFHQQQGLHPYQHQGFYPGQPSYYPPGGPPPQGYHQRQMSQAPPPMGYPMQYAPPRGPPPYGKAPQYPPTHQQHVATAPPTKSSADPTAPHHRFENSGKIDTDEPLFSNRHIPYQSSGPPQQWGAPPRPGTSTGVQTFVTTMSVGDGSKTMRAAPTHKAASTNTDPSNDQQQGAIPSHVGHHRKMSSFSSLSTILGSAVFPEDQVVAQGGHHRQGSSYFHNPTDQSSRPPAPPPGAHHRSTSSSMSFLNSLDDKTVRGHHRSTSSSVSFLHGLDNLDETFPTAFDGSGQQFLGPNAMNTSTYSSGQQFSGGPPRPFDSMSSAQCIPIMGPSSSAPVAAPGTVAADAGKKGSNRLAAGGTSKRVRRKCTVEGCPNRVVQGGLCISHGAKRKQCKYPGCTKNVKKAGLCSTHGPARKRCEAEGCTKVAVQGGRCIAHGAKKKLCSVSGCKKQAILSGMCKKHHDQNAGVTTARRRSSDASTTSERDPSPTVAAAAPKPAESPRQAKKPTHTRGLSIFQEISPENVQTILAEPGSQGAAPTNNSQQDSFGYDNRMM